jgi:hypothetical protein
MDRTIPDDDSDCRLIRISTYVLEISLKEFVFEKSYFFKILDLKYFIYKKHEIGSLQLRCSVERY